MLFRPLSCDDLSPRLRRPSGGCGVPVNIYDEAGLSIVPGGSGCSTGHVSGWRVENNDAGDGTMMSPSSLYRGRTRQTLGEVVRDSRDMAPRSRLSEERPVLLQSSPWRKIPDPSAAEAAWRGSVAYSCGRYPYRNTKFTTACWCTIAIAHRAKHAGKQGNHEEEPRISWTFVSKILAALGMTGGCVRDDKWAGRRDYMPCRPGRSDGGPALVIRASNPRHPEEP